MVRSAIRLAIYAAAFFVFPVLSHGGTPMETMIQNTKKVSNFITVSDLCTVNSSFDKTKLLEKVSAAQALTINFGKLAAFMESKNDAIELVLPNEKGGNYKISLVKYSFLTNQFKVHAIANDKSEAVAYTPGLYYRGIVDGIPGSVAAFSFFNNQVFGIFSIPGEGNFVFTPNSMVGKYYDYNENYLLYNDQDLKIKDKAPKCSTDQLDNFSLSKLSKTTTQLNNNVYTSCQEIKVMELADYDTYVNKGKSTTAVANYVTALFNNQSTLYRNEGVLISLQALNINTTTDIYQTLPASSISYLTMFGGKTQTSMNGADCAILLSTVHGTLGGVAWINTLCSGYTSFDSAGAYAYCNILKDTVVNFPVYSWDVVVVTHEMGHTLGSPHTHACCWNYPGRSTAIDGCYTLEGTCAMPVPKLPVKGGTIMSYCHLTTAGTNFSNGFGTQPGDTIRYTISNLSCAINSYLPNAPLKQANKTVIANRQCIDPAAGVTYYWNDNNTADTTDDILILGINNNSNNIGTLDSTGFEVKTTTSTNWGSGKGIAVAYPSGTPSINGHNYTMQRYWKLTGTKQPTTAIEILFPFVASDVSDIAGSVPISPITASKLSMYKVNSPIDPNPSAGFIGAKVTDFSIFSYGTTASTNTWSLSANSTTQFAHILTTNATIGGTGFFTYNNVSVNNPELTGNIILYPNPASDKVYVSIPGNTPNAVFSIYAVDGKKISSTVVKAGLNSISLYGLPEGIYFYRYIGDNATGSGTLLKK